jgi:predicted RNase H-like nuclease (RuvC/YqgF family)
MDKNIIYNKVRKLNSNNFLNIIKSNRERNVDKKKDNEKKDNEKKDYDKIIKNLNKQIKLKQIIIDNYQKEITTFENKIINYENRIKNNDIKYKNIKIKCRIFEEKYKKCKNKISHIQEIISIS